MKPGIYDGCPDTDYHSAPGVSSSILKEMGRSPAHCRAKRDGDRDKRTKALDTGIILHCAVLEPERFAREYALPPMRINYPNALATVEEMKSRCETEGLPKTGKKDDLMARLREHDKHIELWDDILAEYRENKILLSEADMELCQGVMASVAAHSKAMKAFQGGVAERTLVWEDEATGELCRARMDYYREDLGMIFDLKSCRDARHDPFQRDIPKYGYHISAAMYLEGARACGLKATGFAWLAIEKEPTYAIGLYMASAEMLMEGDDRFREYLDLYHACSETDSWPAYAEEFRTIELPAWAKSNQD